MRRPQRSPDVINTAHTKTLTGCVVNACTTACVFSIFRICRKSAIVCAVSLLIVTIFTPTALAFDTPNNSREREINECAAGEIATWQDAVDKPAPYKSITFRYDPDSAPAWFSTPLVLRMIERAAALWSECGVPAYVSSAQQSQPLMNNEILILWSDPKSGGNIGASDTLQRRLYLSPGVFKTLHTLRPNYDAGYTLQMTLSHEMGHFYGLLAHSRRCVDVLSYYKNNEGTLCNIRDRGEFNKVIEYRSSLPTACDIERCRRLNH